MPPGTVIIYDGDCAFCELWVGRLKRTLPVVPPTLPWQSVDLDEYGLTVDDVTRFAWLITPTNQVAGGAILGKLLTHQPQFGLRVIGHLLALWPVRVIADALYRVVAKNRHRLPGAAPTCESDLIR
jgi:predicted DCC family thiol-disulfide oxidoreductase YuxK